jgi:hypothetical protein
MGVAADAAGALCQLLAQNLKSFDMPKAVGAFEKMDLKLIPCGGIKRPIQVFFCEFVLV